jgi:SpoIVB peptidase S55
MKVRMLRFALCLGLLAVAPLAAVAAVAADDGAPLPPSPVALQAPTLPTISVDEVKAGQRGYGLSVFSGSQPQRFEVEVIGVMRNVSPDVNLILARLTGQGLERSGVSAGMSGSPVFIDGRLAGAVAFSWPFSHEAIASITTIAAMRRLSGTGAPLPIAPPQPPVGLAEIVGGRVPADLLQRELARLKPQGAGGAIASVQWSTSGFGEMSQGVLRQALGSVAPAGEARGGGADLALGDAVAAVLVDGDQRLAAVGTVADRFGDQVLAFGHPFLGMGSIQVPMATAEVVTVLSSQYSSFKISNVGRIVGAFEQDRQAGIQGRLGALAPMIPMVLRVAGPAGTREFHMRLADVPQFTAILVGSSALAGLESASYTAGAQDLDLTARFDLERYGTLELRQSFDGDNAAAGAASYLLAVAGFLTQTPLERVKLRRVEVDLTQSAAPRAATLVGANADHTVVHPGDRVAVNLDLAAYRGDRFRRSLVLRLPQDLPAGRYSLLVGDGSSADAARLQLEPAEPVSFPQALALLRSFHSQRDLVVLGVYGGPGLSVAGEVMPRLPGSVRSFWAAAASGSAVALRSTIAQEQHQLMDVPIQGMVRIELEVRRREPVAAGDAAGGADPGAAATGAVVVVDGSGGAGR